MTSQDIRNEGMRIGGEIVHADDVVEVRYPYTDEVIGTVNIWEQPGYRIEISPFGGIKASGNGVKEGVLEAMRFFTNVKTYSLPWPS